MIVEARTIPSYATTWSMTRCRSALDRATMRHSRSPEPVRGRRDVRPVPPDDPALREPVQPRLYRAPRDVQPPGALQHAGPRMRGQQRDESGVQTVDGSNHTTDCLAGRPISATRCAPCAAKHEPVAQYSAPPDAREHDPGRLCQPR